MISALLVLSIGVVVVALAPRVLTRLTDTGRRPVLGVVAWQVAGWSLIASLVTELVFVLRPTIEPYVHFPLSMHSCWEVLGSITAHRHADWLEITAAVGIAAVLVRVAACGVLNMIENHRRRSRHRELIQLVGHHDGNLDAHVISGTAPVVYCVPGGTGSIVFSRAALARLTQSQQAAVLAHERAHLRGRHHLLVSSSALLRRAFPQLGLFTLGFDNTRRLLEMRADDVAARRHGRKTVAEALLCLVDVQAPAGLLGAAGVSTATRVERLVRPRRQRLLSTLSDAALFGGVVAVAASPVALAVAGHVLLCRL